MRNVISGFGIRVQVAHSGGGSIIGNYIGTDITGTSAIPNTTGITVVTNTKDTKIGGTAPGEANVISGNGRGIYLDFNSSIIKGNSLLLIGEAGNQNAISLDSPLLLKGPFPVLNTLNFSLDDRTRIMLFATGLKLGAGESVSAVAEDPQGGLHMLTVEFVGAVPGVDWLQQVVVKLPDSLNNIPSAQVSITVHGTSSNKVVIAIKSP